jgi:cytochrome c553
MVLLFSVVLSGCLGGGGGNEQAETETGSPVADSPATGGTVVAVQGNSSGRLLASNCYQCHGTYGQGGFDRLLGKTDLLEELREYSGKQAGDDIMAAHAQGYTDAQLQALASYLANP